MHVRNDSLLFVHGVYPMRLLLTTSYSGIGFNNAPPIGLYRLKNYLKTHGFSCDVLDLSLENASHWVQRVQNGEYKIVGMSVSHMHMEDDIKLLSQFRSANISDCFFIAGGQEATYNYKQWLDAGFDAAVLGYGEYPLLAIAQSIQKYGCADKKDLSRISGLAFYQDDEIHLVPAQPVSPEDFELLTFDNVLSTQIPYDAYWDQAKSRAKALNLRSNVFIPELARIYTSSHCPNHCGFCSSHRFLSFAQSSPAKPRMLDADKVFELVLHYANTYGAKGFLFSDDEFLVSRKRATDFCNLVIRAKQNGELAQGTMLNCQARVADFKNPHERQRVDSDFIKLLYAAGFHSISLGVESFSDRLRATPVMNKKGFSGDQVFNVIQEMIDAGITPQVNIILFIPDTTREEIMYNMQCGIKVMNMGCTIAVTTHLLSVPGAPCYNNADYPHELIEITSAITGKSIPVSKHFIPKDPFIARTADQYQQAFNAEQESFLKRNAWPFETVHKSMLGIISFIAIADLLGEGDQAMQWRKHLDMLAQELAIAV